MMSSSAPTPLPPLPVVLPLVGAALLGALRKGIPRAAADLLGLLISGSTVVAAALLLRRTLAGPVVYWFGNWYPRGSLVLGIGFLAEPIGAGLALLAATLTFLALLSAWRGTDSGGNHLQPLMLIFLAAMSGFVLTADLFNMFVFFELMSTAAFALCGLKTAEPAPLQGSFNFAVTNTIAAFCVLTGIALLYAITGALNMAQVGLALADRHDPLVLFAFTLITCGFFTKAAVVPFHLWLPDAHAVSPTPVCVLFSGIMVELGLYAVARLHIVLFAGSLASHAHAARAIIMLFATATILLGASMSFAEHHLKRLLAFSTISHAGLMLLAFAVGGPLALCAMLLYLLAHAFVKSSLFFTSGLILRRLRSISERALFGQGRDLPFVAVLWFAGGAGLAAAPGFLTASAEAATEHAAEISGVPGWLITILFFFSGTLTAAAVFRVGMHTFLGWGSLPLTDEAAEIGELPEQPDVEKALRWYHLAPPLACICAAIALSLLPHWQDTLRQAAAEMASQPAYLHTLYTGQPSPVPPVPMHDSLSASMVHGILALFAALLLAAGSVFHTQLPRPARFGLTLERGSKLLRQWQSGHPGDYVFWLVTGVTLISSLTLIFLR